MGPKGVAVDRNGHIITADNKACCVFIFQSNGKLVTKFGARGTSDRHFAGIKQMVSFHLCVMFKEYKMDTERCLIFLAGLDFQAYPYRNTNWYFAQHVLKTFCLQTNAPRCFYFLPAFDCHSTKCGAYLLYRNASICIICCTDSALKLILFFNFISHLDLFFSCRKEWCKHCTGTKA